MEYQALLARQKAFFDRGAALDTDFRICALKRLKDAIRRETADLANALWEDLNKSPSEAYLTEIGPTLSEIDFAISHIRRWTRPRRVPTPLAHFPAKSRIYPSPYGCTLILSPWNYPFQLAVIPLISALAAGNTAILKPGEDAPATAAALARLVKGCFPEEYVTVVQGGAETSQALLSLPFRKIFFTGSPSVGRLVMAQAAEHLASVTLELGGKCPCIVDETADLALAARRIVFGKFLNAGQTCVAPDYLLVHEEKKEPLLTLLKEEISRQYGRDPLKNPSYVRIINRRHFRRLTALLEGERILWGGVGEEASCKLVPTLLDGPAWDRPVMEEEIFGPILPLLTYRREEEVYAALERHPEPLALYLFTRRTPWREKLLRSLTFGGACVNDTVVHLANPHLPFGGVGTSGLGSCHGRAGFLAFTHEKGVLIRGGRPDLPFRYPPYSSQKDWILGQFLK